MVHVVIALHRTTHCLFLRYGTAITCRCSGRNIYRHYQACAWEHTGAPRRARHGREHELAVAGLLRTLPALSSVRMGTRMSRSAYLVDVVLGFAAVEPEQQRRRDALGAAV